MDFDDIVTRELVLAGARKPARARLLLNVAELGSEQSIKDAVQYAKSTDPWEFDLDPNCCGGDKNGD